MEEMLMAANACAANPNQGSNPNPPAPAPSSAPGGALRGGAPAPLAGAGSTERRARPQKEKALNCPRCNSANTKFCYYNNYSLQQPRYFCKTCRRYWTEGGSLRNVPVGGGSRKNKRSSSSASASASASASTSASVTSSSMASTAGAASKNPKLAHEGAHDLNLAFPHHGGLHAPEFVAFPSLESSNVCNPGGGMTSNGRGGGALSAMELLRSSGCYMPLQVPMQMPGDYTAAGFALGEFRTPPPPPPPSQSVLGFSLDAHGPGSGAAAAGYGSSAGLPGVPENAGRLLFPFEDLKPPVSSGGGGVAGGATGGAGDGNSSHNQFDHNKEQGGGGDGGPGAGHDTPGFWSGMIGGSGASW
ncbi:unnamed protein product [Miscanthus lutarioriparius]|uniref:Dof zinc finger protein n=1 Tax=Miscanthus lutarioriparius TaxID=422564 RepID=A0A811QVC6_9POAL|nr:unnamed protein product [Miscanthus lutarioriparius]